MSTKKFIHLIYIFCDSSTHIDQQTNVRKRFFLARKILLVTNKLNDIYNQWTKMMTIKYTFIARNVIKTHLMLGCLFDGGIWHQFTLNEKKKWKREREVKKLSKLSMFINGFASTSCPLGGWSLKPQSLFSRTIKSAYSGTALGLLRLMAE